MWGSRGNEGDRRTPRTTVGQLRRKLGDDSGYPTYIFTEPRVGYRKPAGETGEESGAAP